MCWLVFIRGPPGHIFVSGLGRNAGLFYFQAKSLFPAVLQEDNVRCRLAGVEPGG